MDQGIITRASPRGFDATVERLLQILMEKNLALFTVVDHSGEARKAGLEMPDTKLVIFGNPAAGTPVMNAAPLAALDLPLKILVWTDDQENVQVSYNSVAYLAERYGLNEELQSRLAGIEGVVGALVTVD